MTTKQMLLSALILGATNNIALSIEKPVLFTMNINSKDFPANLPIPASEINKTMIAFDRLHEESPYAYELFCHLNDLKINQKVLNLDKELSCAYCPSGALNFNTIILGAKDTNDCDKLTVGMLLTIHRELVAEHQKLVQEYNKIKSAK